MWLTTETRHPRLVFDLQTGTHIQEYQPAYTWTHTYTYKKGQWVTLLYYTVCWGEHENINLLQLNVKKVTEILQISFVFKLYTYVSQVWRNQKWSSLPDFWVVFFSLTGVEEKWFHNRGRYSWFRWKSMQRKQEIKTQEERIQESESYWSPRGYKKTMSSM